MLRVITLGLISILAASCSKSPVNGTEFLVPETSIIGGSAVDSTDLTAFSTVSLVRQASNKKYSTCTGTLISADLILTASHCVDEGSELHIYLGEKFSVDIPDDALLNVKEILRHPQYSLVEMGFYTTTVNDVALLRLESPLSDAGSKPVPILADTSLLKEGSTLLLAGYGVTDDRNMTRADALQKVSVKIAKFVDSFIVTNQTGMRGACAGDSGGPAFLETPGGLVVVGATRGPHDGVNHCHGYGEYTNITKFLDFVKEGAKTLGGQEPSFYPVSAPFEESSPKAVVHRKSTAQ